MSNRKLAATIIIQLMNFVMIFALATMVLKILYAADVGQVPAMILTVIFTSMFDMFFLSIVKEDALDTYKEGK